jgi:SpoVK/Ycf46/Vps4 family AAA+-type ATPase
MFLLGGSHVSDRLRSRQYIEQESKVFKPSIVGIKPPKENEPRYSGVWEIDEELLELLTLGKTTPPAFSLDLPAKEINTPLEWSDLILDKRTKEQLMEVASWLAHKDVVLEKWKLAKRIKKGYKVLFHGPSGTGKTLAATLLGKQTETPVYRIDLSVVVSKYIGETEKNLSKLFDKAENKNWILFFDEADALFGKRTSVRDAHDKYANQEVSYLLQRVEDYEGLVILASNLKGNIDSAFLRRFQSVVHFPKPQVKEREQLWKSMWPEKVIVEGEGTLEDLARQHELTGANILNVIQFACLKAAQGKQKKVLQKDLYTAIRRELTKEGKLI